MSKKITKRPYKPQKNEFVQEYLYIEEYEINPSHYVKPVEKDPVDNRGMIVIELF